MKANLVGFTWQLGRGVSLEELLGKLNELNGKSISYGYYDRALFLGGDDDYQLGLFLTIKDQKRTCEITSQGGELVVKVRELESGNSLIDFNFFCINKTTGRGLYQHYFGSCSINSFCKFCKRQYDDLRDWKKERDIIANGGTAITRKKRQEINGNYKGTLDWTVMVRENRIDELLEELQSIRLFEFDFSTLTANQDLFRPLDGCLRLERHTLRFDSTTPVQRLRKAIVDIIQKAGISNGKVAGKDEDGMDATYRILNNPDSFGKFEYEELADETVLNLGNISESPFFTQMRDIINKNKPLFEAPAR